MILGYLLRESEDHCLVACLLLFFALMLHFVVNDVGLRDSLVGLPRAVKTSWGGDYISFKQGDRYGAGMLEIQPDWGDVPSNWVVYFAVENCDSTLEKAKSLGATVEMQPMEIDDVGRFAIIKDPQGAYLTVIQMRETAS
jgi:predicted enzyme related to lactoylglutathione lyase